MKWSEYVNRLIGSRQQSDAALMSGVNQGTISRWATGKLESPNVESAIGFTRALGGNPLEALVILGVIKPGELNEVVQLGASAEDLSNGELVELLARRLGVQVTAREVKGNEQAPAM